MLENGSDFTESIEQKLNVNSASPEFKCSSPSSSNLFEPLKFDPSPEASAPKPFVFGEGNQNLGSLSGDNQQTPFVFQFNADPKAPMSEVAKLFPSAAPTSSKKNSPKNGTKTATAPVMTKQQKKAEKAALALENEAKANSMAVNLAPQPQSQFYPPAVPTNFHRPSYPPVVQQQGYLQETPYYASQGQQYGQQIQLQQYGQQGGGYYQDYQSEELKSNSRDDYERGYHPQQGYGYQQSQQSQGYQQHGQPHGPQGQYHPQPQSFQQPQKSSYFQNKVPKHVLHSQQEREREFQAQQQLKWQAEQQMQLQQQNARMLPRAVPQYSPPQQYYAPQQVPHNPYLPAPAPATLRAPQQQRYAPVPQVPQGLTPQQLYNRSHPNAGPALMPSGRTPPQSVHNSVHNSYDSYESQHQQQQLQEEEVGQYWQPEPQQQMQQPQYGQRVMAVPENPPIYRGQIYSVQFKFRVREYIPAPACYPQTLEIGEFVIVETDNGEDLGVVTGTITMNDLIKRRLNSRSTNYNARDNVDDVGRILRIASKFEVEQLPEKFHDEQNVLQTVKQIAEYTMQLPLHIIDVDFQFDRQKLTILFNGQEKIELRALIKSLFSMYKTLIRFKKIDVVNPFVPDEFALLSLTTGQKLCQVEQQPEQNEWW